MMENSSDGDAKYWSYALRFYSTSILAALVINICLLIFAINCFVDEVSFDGEYLFAIKRLLCILDLIDFYL